MKKSVHILPALFLLIGTHVFALDVPALRGRVNDYADMIAAEVESRIDAQLRDLEVTDSTQVAVLTIDSLQGDALEDFSIRVVEAWALGQKEFDNGVLLLVSKNDRLIRIEVGYGLEGVLTDLLAGRIIDQVIRPRFKSGNINEGFEAGVEAIVQSVRGEYQGSGEMEAAPRRRRSVGAFPFIILFIVVSLLGSRKRYIGGIGGAILLPLILWFVFPLGWIFILAMIPLGFVGGLIIPGLFLFSGRGRGGFRSGGFGGGGFSGGGGGFGGGGASGGW